MKLQIALDTVDSTYAINLVTKVQEYIDIVEIGTPFILANGMAAIKDLHSAFPSKDILADEKIIDGGYRETEMAYKAGAKYVTVLGVGDKYTVRECLSAAKDYGAEIVVDMICVTDLAQRVCELQDIGAKIFAVHTGVDAQAKGRTALKDLRVMKTCCDSVQIAVAGGINSRTISDYVSLSPDIVVVGGAILNADSPRHEAKLIKKLMS